MAFLLLTGHRHISRLLNDLHHQLQLLILQYQLAIWWNHSLSGILLEVTVLICIYDCYQPGSTAADSFTVTKK
jgi:hypothetical protein